MTLKTCISRGCSGDDVKENMVQNLKRKRGATEMWSIGVFVPPLPKPIITAACVHCAGRLPVLFT